MKPAADSGVQQTSATAPVPDATLPLNNVQPKAAYGAQRTTDGYNGVSATDAAGSKSIAIPAPPPFHSGMTSTSTTLAPAPASESNPALLDPPPAAAAASKSPIPSSVGSSDLTPPPGLQPSSAK
jgi:hypothetical protein